MRVLDAFRPRGATWSGQVISSPPGPSGGPSKMHLLPGGGVPRVHRARSPVPPRLPLFATPRSVHQFAAVAAGAYPLCRPPNAWSPGVPALPGPCYWLVASGTPVGWRGGCLALGLVRGAVRHYCLGGCSALVVCARRSRPVRGGWGRCLVLCLPRFPLPAPRFLRLCVAGRPVRVSLILARWYAIPCGLCVPRARSGCPSVFPRVSFVFVCARALAASAPPPLPGLVWRARLARSRCWALVGPFHSVRAPPRVLPRSRAPFGLLGGGTARSRFPLPGLGLRAPRGVGAGVGTRHQPHSARSCELALRAVGAARGRPGGAPLAWVWGVRGRALSHPRPLALWACGRGPLPTCCGCGGVRAWGPVTNPTARALASWLCALWGRHEDARGGRLLPGCGDPGSGALPPPTTRPLGVRPGPTTHWLWVWGGAGVGTRRQPHSAGSCVLALRAVGAARGRPGGAPLAWVRGARGRALSHPGPLARWACGRGPLPTGCGCGGVRAWGPVTNPTARALASWLWALWGRHEGARGGRLLPGYGAPGVGRSPTPDHSPSGRAAGAHYPLAVGVGGCGRGDPSPTPQRALLRAGFARCGGGTWAPGGGASCLGVGRPGSGALPPPTTCPLGVRPGPTTHGLWVLGGAGVGTRHQPHSARSCELALRAVGAARGRPGGAPLAWVWGAWCRALSHPRPLALLACGRGPLPTGCGCGGVRAWGPVTNPTARALASWLCALWGRHEGARGGAPLAWVWGAWCRALSHPRPLALWACGRGPLPTGCGCGGVRAWGPVTNPTARALASWLCALWGRHEDARGGASCLGVGRLVSGALPPPTTCPLGVRPGPTTHGLWVWGGAGVGTRHQPHSARSCELALRAVGAARGRPGGGASCLGVGRLVSGALPPPTTRPLGVRPGPTTHWLWVWGVAGVGTRHQPHFARSCELALRAVGAARGRPRRAPLAWVWGAWCRALSHPRPLALWACGRGPLPTGCGCGGVRAWGPVTNPTARALASWLCALWGRHVGARGGRLLPGCGAPGVGRSPTPDHLPSGRAAGAHYPRAVGVGGCGRGDPSPTPQRALLRAGFARGGGGTRTPGGGASCLGVGRLVSGALPPPTTCPLGVRPGPTTHGLWVWGGAGVGTRHQPHSARSCELALRAVGAARGRPGGGASCLGVGRLVSGALPPPTTRPLGVRPGPTTPWLWVWGGAGVGTRHQPHSARSCELALRAVGAARGRPGGAPLAWVWGAWCRALSHPRPLALWACGRGPLPTGCGCGGVRAWGPVTNPTARALASWLCALWGRHEGARGGAPLAWVWGAWCRALSHPDHSPSGRAAGAHYPLAVGVGGCRRGDPSPTPLRALLRAGFARCGGGTRTPGGGASCLGVGRLVSGALPPPTTRPLGVRPGPTTHWLWVWGGAGVGTRHQTHSARSCVLALRAVGAARGRPGGAPLAWVWGAWCRALSHPRPLALWACGRGPLPTGCGCGGVRAWGPVTHPTARALASWLCALWGWHEGARGGRRLPGCGAPGVGRSPTPDLSSFRACDRGPLPTGRGCGGVRAWGPGSPWHLPLCRGSLCVVCASRVRGTRWPLWLGTCSRAVVVAGGVPLWRALWPRVGAPRLVRSGRSRCSGRLSRRRGAFPHPVGLRPRIYWAAARGTWRPAKNRALCACRWPPPKQGRWARSASYPFGAPRWGCPWRVPPASVLGCVRCGCLRVWTRSLTRPVSHTVRRSTGDSAGAPGLFRVDEKTL